MGFPDNAVEDKIIAHQRWSVIHQVVFPFAGKFYRGTHSVGATEHQRWDDPDDSGDFEEVHQVEKVVKVWEPVEGKEDPKHEG